MCNHLVSNLVLPVKPSRGAQAADDRHRCWWVSMQAALCTIARALASRITLGRDVALRAPAAGFRTREAGARVTRAAIGLASEPAFRIAPVYALTINRGRGDAGAPVAGIAEGSPLARHRVVVATAVAKGMSGLVDAPRGFRAFDDFYDFDLVATR